MSGKTKLAVLLGIASLGAYLLLGSQRHSVQRVYGDEGTFIAMTASLALDHDLWFEESDRARLVEAEPPARRAVILQQTDAGIAFSKSAVFPLMAAPLYRFAGEAGIFALNGIAFFLALLLAWEYLRRVGRSTGEAALVLVTFAGTGVLPAYLAWRMSDSLQTSLAALGIFLCITALQPPGRSPNRLSQFVDSRFAPLLGGIFLGLIASMRAPNAVLAFGPILALLLVKEWRRVLTVVIAFGATFLLALGLNLALTGSASAYKADRASFNARSGYPAGAEAEEALGQFETARATHSLGVRPTLSPAVSAYSALYFFFGRHTGLLLYLPMALILAIMALRYPSRAGLSMLAAAAILAAFYLLWMPRNYFGGGTFLGNRYFLVAYPAILASVHRLPGTRWLIAAWAIACLTFGSALVSVRSAEGFAPTSQDHAFAGIFRALPFESTASIIDSQNDRYWNEEFQRFVDPFAELADKAFILRANRPPSEILMAGKRAPRIVRFAVLTDAPEAEVILGNGLWSRSIPLPVQDGTARGIVDFHVYSPWRRHAFFWPSRKPPTAWTARIGLRTPGGAPAGAEVRYLGPLRPAPRFFASETLEVEAPEIVHAGSTGSIHLRLKNTGQRYWASDNEVEVDLSYRLFQGNEDVSSATDRILTRIFQPVVTGRTLTADLRVQWPDSPGTYTVRGDLILDKVAWFEQWTGSPVFEQEVRVISPTTATE